MNLKKISLANVAMLGIAIALLSSCASISSLQTARTTEKGSIGWGIAGSTVSAPLNLGDTTVTLTGVLGEAAIRYGVTDKLDVGLKLGLIGTSSIDAKYMILGDHESMFGLSAGLSVGYLPISIGTSDITIYDISVPVYASVYPTDWLAIYATPRYFFRSTVGDTGSVSSSRFGTTGGIRLGKRFGVLAEYSWLSPGQLVATPQTQFSAGIVVGIR